MNPIPAIIAIFLVVIGGAYLINERQSFATITSDSYTCKQDYTCTFTPILDCTAMQPYTRVTLRVSEAAAYPNRLAIDAIPSGGDGLLESWARSNVRSSGSVCYDERNIIKDEVLNRIYGWGNVWFIYYNGRVEICSPGSGVQTWVYEPDSSALRVPADSKPAEPYTSSGLEKYGSSANSYSCKRSIIKNGVSIGSLLWQSNLPTTSAGHRGNTYTIFGGDKMTFPGTGVLRIEYAEKYSPPPITTCTASDNAVLSIGQSYCVDSKTLVTCEAVADKAPILSTTKVDEMAQPPQVCRDNKISAAYSVDVAIDKTILQLGESIAVSVKLYDTPDAINKDVTATLMRGSQNIGVIVQKTTSAGTNVGRTAFSIKPPEVGDYQLIISFPHASGSYEKTYDLLVAEPLTLILDVNKPVQYTNAPVSVFLKSYKSGEVKDVTNYEIEAYFNQQPIQKDYLTVVHPSTGILELRFTGFTGDGNLKVRARGTDEMGAWTAWTEYKSVSIKKASIMFKTEFVNDVCTGTYTNKFTTAGPQGDLIDVAVTLIIDKPLGGKTDQPNVKGSDGQYSFTYNFEEGGLYTVRITASTPSYGGAQLNGGSGQTINVLSGPSCGTTPTTPTTPTTTPTTNWLMYGIMGTFVAGILWFAYVAFAKKAVGR